MVRYDLAVPCRDYAPLHPCPSERHQVSYEENVSSYNQTNSCSTTANWAFNFMVVMITPVAFANIGYQTYIIFAVINAAMVPSVYFFFPETAGRSLEEMDEIFHKTTNVFNCVQMAKDVPHRFDKRGNLLIDYIDTEEAREAERRRSSVIGAAPGIFSAEKDSREHTEKAGSGSGI